MSNNISYDKYGINLYGCGNVTASNNRIYNSTDYGIYGYTENNSVSNNDIKNVTNTGEFAIGSGIYSGAGLGGSGYNNITNNNISNTYYGIYLTGILNNISNNRINSTTLGIYNPTGTYNNTIKNNTISYSSQYGIMLNNSDYNNIQNNTLTSNGDGLLFYNSTNNDITDDNNISFNSRLGVVFIDSYPNINMTQVENNTDGKGIFSWSVFAEVRNTTGFVVENAYLDAKNVSAIISSFNYSEYYTPINSFTTDSLGDTSRFIVYENKTLNDSTTTKYNNHTFFANKTAIGSGKNISNVTERMKIIIVITPHAPVVSNVFVDDDTLPLNNISLYGATTRNVKCNATIVDEDGWWDVNVSNITFFDTGYQWYSPDDNNTHYSNSSCNLFGWSGIDTSLYAECIAPIWYYANSTFWNCNMTVNDTFNNVSWANDTNYIDGLLAIGLNNTTEFGVVNAGQISSNDVNNTVTNYGNIRIDLQLNGSQMPCTYGGSLPVGLEKYNCTNYNQNYDTRMDNLTTSLNGANCTGFDLTKQKDLAESMKNVSWKIQIPATGFGGVCTGTIWYTAMSG
jgi:parallel beta-helix repeat protein